MSEPHTLEGGQVLSNTHSPDKCAATACCIHNMSPHPLRAYAQRWNGAYMERVSPEGEIWPDPDDPFAPKTPNAVRCVPCDEVLYSAHRHDFVSCSGGHVFVDGGSAYQRRGWDTDANYEEIDEWPIVPSRRVLNEWDK